MSIETCVKAKIKSGDIPQDRGKELLKQWRDKKALLSSAFSEEIADSEAAKEILAELDAAAKRSKYLANLRIQTAKRISDQMLDHEKGVMAGAMAHLMRDPDANVKQIDNVSTRQQAVLGVLHAKFADGIQQLRPKKLGLDRNKAQLRSVVRSLFGEETGDALSDSIAKAWSETAEYARKRFNAAGGDIRSRRDWGLPQTHDMRLVGKVEKQAWVDEVILMLDRNKMLNDMGNPLSDAELSDALAKTYDRIVTDGLVDLNPGSSGGKSLANRHQDHRFLQFKGADNWLAYQAKFGSADTFGVMMNHLEAMSKDISAMEVLGPNPDWMIQYMADTVKVEFAKKGKPQPTFKLQFFQDAWRTFSGRTSAPINANFANIMAGTRNILTSAQLGAAFLSSITDLGFQRVARKTNGLPQMTVFKDILKLMNPLDEGDQKLAVQLGLIADNWSSQAMAQQRYFGEVTGPEVTKWLADSVLKASLLSPWTQAGRWAFGMEFLGFLGRESHKTVMQLPEEMREAFKRYGITTDDWNKIRSMDKVVERGAEFVSPVRLTEAGELELAAKLQNMIVNETDFAVPSVDLRTRTITKMGTNPGDIKGELLRSVAMYKSFPVTVITTHLMRGLSMNGNKSGKYLADLFITMTLLGGLAYQAKQMQKGRDPVPMDPTTSSGQKFWVAAMAQGGGLGIFGDFVFSDANRFGKGPITTMAGPVADLGDDLIKLSIGNAQELAKGEETKFLSELTRAAGRYTPGSSLWYARLAFERMIIDQLELKIDPKTRKRYRRIEKKARREYDQGFWWKHGSALPDRLPE